MKTLLVFTASWCGVCRQIKPTIEIEAPQKGYMIEYIDLDTEQGLVDAEDYKVRSLPTLIVLDEEGAEIRRASGNTAWKEVQK